MKRFFGRKLVCFTLLLVGLSIGSNCLAQQPAPHGFDGPPPGPGRHGDHDGGPGRPGAMHLQLGPPGRWWNDPDMARRVGLSPEQQKKMDEIFTANRLKLIDLFATVQKEETIMEPLVAADPPDENKVLGQIDRVAQARAELEKANARMLFELLRQLTHDQFVKLQSERPAMHHGERGPHGGMRGGPKGGPDAPPDQP